MLDTFMALALIIRVASLPPLPIDYLMPWNGAIRTNAKRRAWYTTADVAALLGVSTETVRDWCQAGKLAFELSPGGRYRFAASDIAKWISKRASA